MPAPLLAAKLVELRQSRGLSQKDVAECLDITREAYSHYERSTREPSLEAIYKLAKFYNVDVSELIGPLPDEGTSKADSGNITKNMTHFLKIFTGKNSALDLTDITKEDISILARYKSLNRQGQKEVRDFIEFKHSQNRKKQQ